MLGWTLIFLIVALVAGVLGFTGIAGAAGGANALRVRQPGAARPPGLRPGPCVCPPWRAGRRQAVPADPHLPADHPGTRHLKGRAPA